MIKRFAKNMFLCFLMSVSFFAISCSESDDVSEVLQEADAPEEVVSHSALAIEDTILKEKTIWADNQTLYSIPNEIVAQSSGAQLYRFQNDLLLLYSKYNTQEEMLYYYMDLISIETGELIASNSLPVISPMIQVLNGHVVIFDEMSGHTYLLDETLQVKKEYQFDAAAVYFDEKLEKAYLLNAAQGIKQVDLNTSEEKTLLANARDIVVGGYSDGCVSFTYVDVDTLLTESGMLNVNTSDFQKWEIDYSCQSVGYGNDTWYGWLQTEGAYHMTANENDTYVMNFENMLPAFWDEAGHIAAVDNSADSYPVIRLYGNDGTFLSSCVLSNIEWMGMNGEAVWFEEYNGYFFSLTGNDGQGILFFWDISEGTEGQNIENLSASVLDETISPGDAVSQACYDRAAALSEKYGMPILIADQCDAVIGEYVMTASPLPETDENINVALDGLEKALQVYPEGFFDQLYHDHYREIEIQLLNAQIQKEGMDSVGAFVHHEGHGKFVMGIDVRDLGGFYTFVEQHVYHEFSHIIDTRLSFEAKYREGALYSEEQWVSLNPEGFEYTGDGSAVYGTVSSYRDYFVDDYACTDEGEDRARILEYAMMGTTYPDNPTNYYWDETYCEFFETRAGLKAKLDYYGKCIRDGFDTTGWPEITAWEK